MSEIELHIDKWYLIKSIKTRNWHVLKYSQYNNGAYSQFDNGHFYVRRDQVDEIIPLDLAIKAGALQAENERLRAVNSLEEYTAGVWKDKYEHLRAVNAELLAALEFIRDKSRSWHGSNSDVPFWNLGDKAAATIKRVSAIDAAEGGA